MTTIRFCSFAMFGIFAAMVAPKVAIAVEYKIIDRIKVPDGAFDYATFNPATNQVFMPRGSFTTVIDVKTNKVTQLESAVGDHIALPVPGTSLLVLTQRQGTIRIVDAAKDAVVADLAGGKNPNSAAYDPVSKTVLVLNKESGNAAVVDPLQRKIVATIPVSNNTLEFPVSDGAGTIYDNIETTAEIAVIDVKARKVTQFFKLDGCEDPTGLAYAAASRLLIAACGNGVAKFVRADTGKEVASLAIGRGRAPCRQLGRAASYRCLSATGPPPDAQGLGGF